MFRIVTFACLLALCYSLPTPVEDEKQLEDRNRVLSEIFGVPFESTQPSTKPPATVKRETEKKEADEKCTVKGKEGMCVAYYLCDQKSTDDPAIIDIHFTAETECTSYIDVCCLKENVAKSPPPLPKESAKTGA